MGRVSSWERAEDGPARGALSSVSGGGLWWTVEAADSPHRMLVEKALERFRDLPADPAAEVIKSNRVRTVLRFDPRGLAAGTGPWPVSGGWILKQYRHGDWLDRLRYRFVPSRAAQEWRVLRRLRALGFRAPRPLAFGERRLGRSPVEGGLLMEEVPGATSLLDELWAAHSGREGGELPAAAAELLARAGALVRSLHDHGLDQPDLHPSNLLLSAGGNGEFHVIDLHSARFRRRLSRRRRLLGLAKLVHSLSGVTPPAGIRRLLEAYLTGSGLTAPGVDRRGPAARADDLPGLRHLLRSLERKARRIGERRLKSRQNRCVKPSTTFAVDRGWTVRTYRRREILGEELLRLTSDCGAPVAIKVAREGSVSRATVGGREYLVKHRRYTLAESLAGLLVAHRLLRAYRAGYALEVRAVPTPRVLALREKRFLGLVRRAWLVTDLVPDGISLQSYLAGEYLEKPPPRGRAAMKKHFLARRVGSLVRMLHDHEIYTQDLSPQNIIVSPSRLEEARILETAPPEVLHPALPSPVRRVPWSSDPDPLPAESTRAGEPARHPVVLADLDSVHLWRRLGPRRRLSNLVQVGNLPEGHVSWADRLRALHAYARGEERFLAPELIRKLREGLLREAERTLHRLLHKGLKRRAEMGR